MLGSQPPRPDAVLVVDLSLGANKTSMPNLEFVLRRALVVPWLTTPALIGQDAKPVAVFAELRTSEVYGLGLPASQLDQAALDASADNPQPQPNLS